MNSRIPALRYGSTMMGFYALVMGLSLGMSLAPVPSRAADRVVFATNWLAQGGHGGYYQAVVDGTYARYGLDVEIRFGGPQVNNRPLLAAGKIDFYMGGNLLPSFDGVRNGIPTTIVAAIFQKDPLVLIAHKGRYASFQDLTTAPKVLISKGGGQFTHWKWLVAAHGFRDEQFRPYGYNLAPFLQDKNLVQQGYATAEPLYAAEQGADPVTYLMADYGWVTYSTTIEVRREMIENNPDLVQRFVDASIIGWYNFLYGDRTDAYKVIIANNPELTEKKLDKEMEQYEKLGIIDVGDALSLGIGAITQERLRAFEKVVVDAGIIETGSVDLNLVATERFVNKGVGIDIRKKATGK